METFNISIISLKDCSWIIVHSLTASNSPRDHIPTDTLCCEVHQGTKTPSRQLKNESIA